MASITGWGFAEIMEELPFAAGIQIIDAGHFTNGIQRVYASPGARIDKVHSFEQAFQDLTK